MRSRFLAVIALIVVVGRYRDRIDVRAGCAGHTMPGRTLPVVRQHTYRMAGKIRVLLLWVGRDDVGSGVIKWRGGGDEKAIELLIGSDPNARAEPAEQVGISRRSDARRRVVGRRADFAGERRSAERCESRLEDA